MGKLAKCPWCLVLDRKGGQEAWPLWSPHLYTAVRIWDIYEEAITLSSSATSSLLLLLACGGGGGLGALHLGSRLQTLTPYLQPNWHLLIA